MNNKLVVYFSATGHTKKVATQLAKEQNASLYEIEPKDKYTSNDLDWLDTNSRSSLEMNNESSRPEILNKLGSVSQYDTIFIGFPIWWYVEPRIIDTFLDANDLSNKNIILFATSGGSRIDSAVNHLKTLYPQLHFHKAMLLK